MDFREKLANPYLPVTLFEMVPPAVSKAGAIEETLSQAEKIRHRVDAINLPEIHDEARGQDRTVKFVERVEPRALGKRIRSEVGLEVIVNRCVVYDADQVGWLRQTEEEHGIGHVVLVGGESSRVQYPGPTVTEAAKQAAAAGLHTTLGGISIPSRLHEPERVRHKAAAGLGFFTTQVLFDSNDIVWLIQKLNGVEARIFLSFAPVSHPRDIEFLRWLGADIPADLDRFLLQNDPAAPVSRLASQNNLALGFNPADAASKAGAAGHTRGSASERVLDRSLDLAQRILMDVFDNLPPDPPPVGINIEHINKRNFAAAVRMLDRLNELYRHLVSARAGGG
jgi:5,10-methylenetetrahydrofolate reductase